MLRNLLQWCGLLAVIGIGAAGIGGMALVKDRIEVVIQPAGTGTAPDPLAMVRDDLRQVHADLEAIAQGLDTLGRAIGSQAEADAARDDALQQQLSRLATVDAHHALVRGFDALRAEVGRLNIDLHQPQPAEVGGPVAEEVAAVLAESSPRPVAATPAQPPVAQSPVAQSPVAQSPGTQSPGTQSQPPSSPATKNDGTGPTEHGSAPKARPKSFLSFALPSARQTFDAPMRYRVIPSLSRVGFDAKSTLHDFSGVTSAISGELHANLADPKGRWHGTIRCRASTLRTGVDGRDENMREHLAVDKFPEITFEVTGFEPDPGSLDVKAQRVAGTVVGKMTIRGKTRELRMPVKISVDESRRINISGQTTLALPDYDVPVPSQLGLISMEEKVVVWVALKARAAGPAQEPPSAH